MQEITGIFDSKHDLDKAVEKLATIGVSKKSVTLLATEKDIREKLGNDYHSIYELENKKDVPRISFISEKSFYSRENLFITALFYLGIIAAVVISASNHQSIATSIAVAFFAGIVLQLIGICISGIFRKKHGDYIDRKLDKGGLLFWIRVKDKKTVNKVRRILKHYLAHDIHSRTLSSKYVKIKKPH